MSVTMGRPIEDPLAGPGTTRLRVVAEALAWRGSPYRFGGRTMKGVDCSGFVHEVLIGAEVGGEIPLRASGFSNWGSDGEGRIEPGDILLFGKDRVVSHVGIALSEDSFIHAASEGRTTGVIISALDDPSWRSKLVAVRSLGER